MTDRPPMLDYQTPGPRPSAVSAGALGRFAGGVFAMMLALILVDAHSTPAAAITMPAVITAMSASTFLVTDAIRRAVSKRAIHERGRLLTLAVGSCCVAVPAAVRLALLGRTETFPWTATVWLVCVVAAPIVVYPPVESD